MAEHIQLNKILALVLEEIAKQPWSKEVLINIQNWNRIELLIHNKKQILYEYRIAPSKETQEREDKRFLNPSAFPERPKLNYHRDPITGNESWAEIDPEWKWDMDANTGLLLIEGESPKDSWFVYITNPDGIPTPFGLETLMNNLRYLAGYPPEVLPGK